MYTPIEEADVPFLEVGPDPRQIEEVRDHDLLQLGMVRAGRLANKTGHASDVRTLEAFAQDKPADHAAGTGDDDVLHVLYAAQDVFNGQRRSVQRAAARAGRRYFAIVPRSGSLRSIIR